MKFYTLFLALTALFGTSYAYADSAAAAAEKSSGLNWTTDYSAALQHAKAENKPLFLYFTGSDWCPWCMKMDSQILSDPEFQKQAGNSMIFVMLDFPHNTQQDVELKKQNQILYEKFGVKGFPTVILLDPNGNKIGQLGYQAGGGAAYAKKIADMLAASKK